jgi:hypothetical protein
MRQLAGHQLTWRHPPSQTLAVKALEHVVQVCVHKHQRICMDATAPMACCLVVPILHGVVEVAIAEQNMLYLPTGRSADMIHTDLGLS